MHVDAGLDVTCVVTGLDVAFTVDPTDLDQTNPRLVVKTVPVNTF